MKDLSQIANRLRAETLTMIHRAKSGHTGGSLSSIDILVALHHGLLRLDAQNPKWPQRDRFVLSKGHSIEGYLCVLADLGFFPRSELATFCAPHSRLIGHPNVKVPGIEVATGALGHGLSIATGMALGAKRKGHGWQTYVLMGDGELAEGSVWEAAMAASCYRLDNLTAIVDRNRLQISGDTEDVMPLENLVSKWQSFGWQVAECDGHHIPSIISAIQKGHAAKGKPHLVIAHTRKGKGVSFIENQAGWHHRVPDEQELKRALEELEETEVIF